MTKKLGKKEIDGFKDFFRDFKDSYVLIGGSACLLLLNEAGFDFRATKDLDIVLCVETLNSDFVTHFWSYLKKGNYKIAKKANGDPCFYRFEKPEESGFPFMIEILSALPELFSDLEDFDVLPMALEEEIISLSAIILNQDYYDLLVNLKTEIEGITLADHRVIIPLKVRAYLDLKTRKENGEMIKSNDIKKHKNDVFRLSRLLVNEKLENIPEVIRRDMALFNMDLTESDHMLRQIGITELTVEEIKNTLTYVYGL